MAFDAKRFLIKVQGGRTYLPVAGRLVWFREDHPDWGIVTEPLCIDHEKQFAVFRATIFDETGRIMATATKKEDVRGFGDYIEKAETGSVGRALLMCGYGTETALDELDSAGPGDTAHIVDTPQQGQGPPVRPSRRPSPPAPARQPQPAEPPADVDPLKAERLKRSAPLISLMKSLPDHICDAYRAEWDKKYETVNPKMLEFDAMDAEYARIKREQFDGTDAGEADPFADAPALPMTVADNGPGHGD